MPKRPAKTTRRQPSGQFQAPVPSPAALEEQSGSQLLGHAPAFGSGYPYSLDPGLGSLFGAAFGFNPYANGGAWDNPMGFPGYAWMYIGNPVTYRWMLQHPTLRMVRSVDNGIIAAGGWDYEAVEDGDEEARGWADKEIKPDFDNLRDLLINNFMARGRDMGWAGGEPVWKYVNNRYRLLNVKDLLPDVTEVLRDKHGNFTGLKNYVPVRDENRAIAGPEFTLLAAPYKAWKFTYDSEAGYPYGRSWLENARSTAWRMWLDCAQRLAMLKRKIVGTLSVMVTPPGTFPGPNDAQGNSTKISYQTHSKNVIAAVAAGAAGVWLPSVAMAPDAKGSIDALRVLKELLGKSLTSLEVKDFGSQAAAISGILEEMKHCEELMFEAGLRSPLAGLAGEHGNKSIAEQHTDTGTLNAEADHREFARQCQPLVDARLTLNFGDRSANRVRIKPRSLVDRREAVLKAITLAMMNDPIFVHEAAQALDLSKMFSALGVALTARGFKPEEIKRVVDEMNKQKNQGGEPKRVANPDPSGGRPASE